VDEEHRVHLKPPTIDSLFAAAAAQHVLSMVTRNTRDFAALDLDVSNPWIN
jgi:predicted nucleic acid-binding protein